jgi:hypothetical protein
MVAAGRFERLAILTGLPVEDVMGRIADVAVVTLASLVSAGRDGQ